MHACLNAELLPMINGTGGVFPKVAPIVCYTLPCCQQVKVNKGPIIFVQTSNITVVAVQKVVP